MNIILGSTSPRRKEVLSALFGSFEIIAPKIDEKPRRSETPVEFSMRISEEKCLSIVKSNPIGRRPSLIITADTVVTIKGAVIGKPVNFDDAVRIISLLNGKTHHVITGLTLLAVEGGKEQFRPLTHHEITEVKFKRLRNEEIVGYLSRIEYRDKAGSYAFQEHGDMIIDRHRGSVTNIIGFPLRLFFAMLVDRGLAEAVFN